MTQPAHDPDDAFVCPHCGDTHGRRYLCDIAAGILDAVRTEAVSHDMPTIELDAPIRMPLSDGRDVHLIGSVDGKALLIPFGSESVHLGAVALFPRSVSGEPMAAWLYAGSNPELDRFVELVTDLVDMAKRAAIRTRE